MSMSTRKRKQLKFTKEEEKVMIAFMKEHSFLWDINHNSYKNTLKKDQAWKKMANLMGGKNIEQLKKRWRNIRDYENYKKKADIKKTTPLDKSRNGINKVEDDSIDLSFLQRSPTECTYVCPLNYLDEEDAIIDPLEMEEASNDDNMRTETTNQITPTNNVNKRKKQPNDDRFGIIMEEHTKVLKELAKSSNTLKELCRQPKSVLLQYFELYHTEIDRLPVKLRLECQREVQNAITSIIYKFQDQAEELKQSAEE